MWFYKLFEKTKRQRFFLAQNDYLTGRYSYSILGFNIPLDTVQVISETGALNSDVHLPFSNGGPAT